MTGREHRDSAMEAESASDGALSEALASVRPPFDATEALAIARGGADRPRARRSIASTLLDRRAARRPRRLRRTLRWAVPTVAGAGAALSVWFATRAVPEPLPAMVQWAAAPATEQGRPDVGAVVAPDTPEEEPVFSIDAPEGGQVAVFQTSNPKIRVVWFYGESESED
ncbi:MAG: hypothetical protein OEU54_05560 [Gemmatimonadota bacterium]|nr:hypothetical protein [Gemmatimonadota bacterium]